MLTSTTKNPSTTAKTRVLHVAEGLENLPSVCYALNTRANKDWNDALIESGTDEIKREFHITLQVYLNASGSFERYRFI